MNKKSSYYLKLTKDFALDIIKLTEEFPKNNLAFIVSRQIIKSATSIGANYRAVCRARSKSDFIAKLGLVEEESDETLYWLEIIKDTDLSKKNRLDRLFSIANHLLSFAIASQKTAKKNPKNRNKSIKNYEQSAISNQQSTKNSKEDINVK